jgi:hypothetical protein
MAAKTEAVPAMTHAQPTAAQLLEQYGCGPVRFTGSGDGLYERRLMFLLASC